MQLLCSRVIVMYLGRIVQAGPVEAIFRQPRHPYTQALISAIPGAAPDGGRVRLDGEPRRPIDPSPTVCRFVGRCRLAGPECEGVMPQLHDLDAGHQVACHRAA